MIYTLSLNPSIDRTLEVRGFAPGATHRIVGERSLAAGKGVNVAVAAQRLGLPVSCMGLLPRDGGEAVRKRLAAEGIPCAFVDTPGSVRVNLKVLDTDKEQTTELNRPGEAIGPGALEGLWALLNRHLALEDILVLTGSLPPGCPPDLYGQIMRRFGGRCRVVLDAQGTLLARHVQERPWLVKPNLAELSQAVGEALVNLSQVRRHALELINRGAGLVAVSMGAEGALLTDGGRTLFAPSLPVKVASTVCAGDSMVAGMLYALLQGGSLWEVLRCGVAAATATVARPSGELVRLADFAAFCPQVSVREIC